MAKDTTNKTRNLTQRLDHMVPDPNMTLAANQRASADLASISSKLYRLLPDESLSPLERLERLARVIEKRKPDRNQLQSASSKLTQLTARIDKLVPGDMTPEKKIEVLLEGLDGMVSKEQCELATIEKLELLGDPRGKVAPERPARRRPRR
jgi:hypothetical protein